MSISNLSLVSQHGIMTALEVISRHMETLPGDHCPDCFNLIEIARTAYLAAGGALPLGAPRGHRDREALAGEWIMAHESEGRFLKLDYCTDDHIHYDLTDGFGQMVSWADVRLELARVNHGLKLNPA